MATPLNETGQVLSRNNAIPMSNVVWQYMNDSNEFVNMPPYYNLKHEEHFRDGIIEFEYEVVFNKGRAFYRYEVNLSNMIQSNMHTGTVRHIRRLVVCNS